MIIKFLGTGTSQGVPVIGCHCSVCSSDNPKDNRLRSSVFLEEDETKIVIDAGPDFRQQLLREKIEDLDAVLFTHEHKDHIAGLDDIRPINYLKKKEIDVFATPRVIKALKREYQYIFSEDPYPGIPQIKIHPVGKTRKFKVKSLEVTPVEVFHHKLPVLGFRIKNFAYITDANMIPVKELKKLRSLEVLVLNALRKEPHLSHFHLEAAVKMAQQIGAKKNFFHTHKSFNGHARRG